MPPAPAGRARAVLLGALLCAGVVATLPAADAAPFASVGAFPGTTTVGATTTYRIFFDRVGAWDANGYLQVTFPAGFDITGAAFLDQDGIDGGFLPATDAGQVLTIRRDGTGTSADPAVVEAVRFSNIVSHAVPGTYPLQVELLNGASANQQGPGLAEVTLTTFSFTSTAFTEGGAIPVAHTCDGADLSPPLRITGSPPGTVSTALYVHDLDAGAFTHWAAWSLPVDADLPAGANLVALGGREADNDFPGVTVGYGGPCPPSGIHHYLFHAVALDGSFVPPPHGADPAAFYTALGGSILEMLTIEGIYPEAATDDLAFLSPPEESGVGLPLGPTVRVRALDGGAPVPDGTPVELRLEGGPAAARLVNGPGQDVGQDALPTAMTLGGVASFPGIAVDLAGTYRLNATSGAAWDLSAPFTVRGTGAPWAQFHQDAQADGAELSGRADFGTRNLSQRALATAPAGTSPIVGTPLLADLDSDGDLDLLAGTDLVNTPAGTMSVKAFFQSGGALSATPTWSATIPATMVGGQPPSDGTMRLAAADLDVDGDMEVVVYTNYANAGFGNGAVQVLSGATGAALSAPMGLTIGEPNPPVVGDVTGDGIPEILLTHTVGGLAPGNYLIGLNYAGGFLGAAFDQLLADTISMSNIALVEVRAAHPGLEVAVGHNGGNGVGSLWLCSPGAGGASCGETLTVSDGVFGLSVANLDGDPEPELAVNQRTTIAPARFALQVVEMVPALAVAGSDGGSPYQWNTAAVADVNGDGRSDIVNVIYSEFARTVDTFRNGDVTVRSYSGAGITDQGRLARPAPPGGDLEPKGGGILLDADLDGTPEFLFGSPDGNLTAVRVEDAAPASPPTLLWRAPVLGATSFSPPAAGDVTGDCRPEALVGLSTGSVAILAGASATLPAGPSFTTPVNYANPGAWAAATPPASPGPGLQARLAWNAPADGGLPIVEYRVYRGPSAAFVPTPAHLVGVWPSGTPPTPANPYVDDTVPDYGDYHYKIAAVTCLSLQGGAGTFDGGVLNPNAFRAEVRRPAAPGDAAAAVTKGADPAYAGPAQVTVSWVAAAPNAARPHGCGAVDGYNVYRGTASGSYGPAPLNGATPVAGLAFDDSAPPGSLYFYRIHAVNCVGEELEGSSEAVADLRVPAPLAAPTLTPSQLPVKVTVSWTLGDVNGCGWAEGVRIERSVNGGAFAPYADVRPTGVAWPRADPPADHGAELAGAYADTAVSAGSTYGYRVSAVNCAGAGLPSPPRTISDLVPPTVGSLSTLPVGADRIDLSWSPAATDNVGVVSVEVHRGPSGFTMPGTIVATPVPSATSHQDLGLVTSTLYCYRVRVRDAAGNTADTNMACATAGATGSDPVPPTIGDLLAAPGEPGTMNLTWGAAADNVGVTAVEVHRGAPGFSIAPTTQVAATPIVATTATAHVDANLFDETLYCYRVRARDAAGNVADTGEACNTTAPGTDLTPPVVGTLVAAATAPGEVALSWPAVVDNFGVAEIRVLRGGLDFEPPEDTVLVAVLGPGETAHLDTGMAGSTPTCWVLVASDDSGNEAESNYACLTTLADPDLEDPQAGPLEATALDAHRILVTWPEATDDVGIVQLDLYHGPPGFTPQLGVPSFNRLAGIATLGVHGVSFLHTGLHDDSMSCYVLIAADAAGKVNQTAEACATTMPLGPFRLRSDTLVQGATVPIAHTCSGLDLSPHLRFENVTWNVSSLALVVEDATENGFVHWLAWNLPPDVGQLAAGANVDDLGAVEGLNDFGAVRYDGPCPTAGVHSYAFRAILLDDTLALAPGSPAAALEAAMVGHVLATDQIVATYGSVESTPAPTYSGTSYAASAGAPQVVTEGDPVTLNGTGGSAVQAARIAWIQVAGPTVALSGPDSALAQFTAPEVAGLSPVILRFRILLYDPFGNSVLDETSVTVMPRNEKPLADAEGPAEVSPGEEVRLDGSLSKDHEGEALAFEWSQLEGPDVAWLERNGSQARLRVPSEAREGETLTLQLVVRDGLQASLPDTLHLRVGPAGSVAQVRFDVLGFEATFRAPVTGSGLTYRWDFGDGATSSERDPRHAYAGPGDYGVTLVVTEADGLSSRRFTTHVLLAEPEESPPGRGVFDDPPGPPAGGNRIGAAWGIAAAVLVGLGLVGGIFAWHNAGRGAAARPPAPKGQD